ncbi:hypothetical protein EDEG_03397 [Edhazardia aedis USNM 41457]|uniref:Uncharacterized protein n=1 Tax=Edhazardia aedis (strain USNM 41457) TaxID=1003232 RepID=J8ZR42_EDHAE|nr:hypothetical protein EDEG_03397 [Edhazardia aedis USNM 41457]|eukprot:EJW02153.1 hypothetical protein EDEG_03397 [Edhazardia aedis USNM 41457]
MKENSKKILKNEKNYKNELIILTLILFNQPSFLVNSFYINFIVTNLLIQLHIYRTNLQTRSQVTFSILISNFFKKSIIDIIENQKKSIEFLRLEKQRKEPYKLK